MIEARNVILSVSEGSHPTEQFRIERSFGVCAPQDDVTAERPRMMDARHVILSVSEGSQSTEQFRIERSFGVCAPQDDVTTERLS